MVTEPTAPTLNRDEFASLQEIGKVMQRIITLAHRDLLIAFGYVAVHRRLPSINRSRPQAIGG